MWPGKCLIGSVQIIDPAHINPIRFVKTGRTVSVVNYAKCLPEKEKCNLILFQTDWSVKKTTDLIVSFMPFNHFQIFFPRFLRK